MLSFVVCICACMCTCMCVCVHAYVHVFVLAMCTCMHVWGSVWGNLPLLNTLLAWKIHINKHHIKCYWWNFLSTLNSCSYILTTMKYLHMIMCVYCVWDVTYRWVWHCVQGSTDWNGDTSFLSNCGSENFERLANIFQHVKQGEVGMVHFTLTAWKQSCLWLSTLKQFKATLWACFEVWSMYLASTFSLCTSTSLQKGELAVLLECEVNWMC